jgi:hypothetical protein
MADSSYAEHHRTGHWEGIVLLTGSFGVVFCELFTGGISLNHILYGAAGSSDGTNRTNRNQLQQALQIRKRIGSIQPAPQELRKSLA